MRPTPWRMTESFDLLIRGGVCATPNGIAPADVGVKGGRIAAIGALGARQGGGGVRGQGASRPARRHRHPGAFPRARQRAQGRPGKRQPRGGPGRRHRRLRDAQHRSADHDARRHRGQARPRRRADALRLRVLCRGHAGQCRRAGGAGAAARRLRRQGVSRLVHRHAAARPRGCDPGGAEGRHAAHGRSFRRRSAAQGAQSIWPCAATCAPIRSGAMPKRRAPPPSACCAWRGRRAGACMCCM